MAIIKYSRQRECIENYLMLAKNHPTADTVYRNVKKEFPNISLGTVYRNLNFLVQNGRISKIPTPNGGDRFDGNTKPHSHFCCTACGRLTDLDMEGFSEVIKAASQDFHGEIHGCSALFYGVCRECLDQRLEIFGN